MQRIGYEAKKTVSFFQIDANQNMSPAALLSDLQEVAITHSDTLGYTLDYMLERKWAWTVVNWHLNIHRMPRHGETITIQTWSNKFVRFQAERSFFMFDEAGNKILDGMSRWVFMDLEKRKPTNVPKEMAERCHGGQEPAILDEKFLVPKQAQGELLCTRALVVTRRDTDTNGHANNVKYLEWAMDDLPDAIYDEMDLKDIRIVYRKECMRGDRVELKTFVQDTDGGKEVFSFLYGGEMLMAEVITLWQTKEKKET